MFALKLLCTEYTKKEWALIVFFEVIGIISYKVTGKNDVIRIVTFVSACKEIPLKQMLRYTFYVTLAGCAVIVLLAVTGVYGEMSLTMHYGKGTEQGVVYEEIAEKAIEETRYTLGMGHPNALACMFLMTLALGIYAFSEYMKWHLYLFLLLLTMGIYGLTASRTSTLISILLLVGAFIMTYCRFFREKKAAYICGFLVFVLCVGFSVDAAACAGRVRIAQWRETYWGDPREVDFPDDKTVDDHIVMLLRIDQHINGRIQFLTNTDNNDGTIDTWSVFSCPNNMEHYFDMGWVKLFYRYGVIPGILYCAACCALLWQFYKKRDAYGLVVFTVLAIYSVSEAHLFSVYIGRNFLLMMMGSSFFGICETDMRKQIEA